jgi:hypothetical protein
MARTDRRGRGLKTFLIAEITGQDITVEEMRQAVGVKRSRWYGDADNAGRAEADNFPDPVELLSVADHFNLGQNGWLNLMIEFGWLDPIPSHPGFTVARRNGTSVSTQPLRFSHRDPPT